MNQKNNYKSLKTFFIAAVSVVGGLFLILMISVLILRWVNPPFTSFTLQEDREVFEAERYNLREWWVPENQIPDHMKWAVIASEDQLFMEHHGFDIESIKEAIDEQREGRRTRGASTISQQTAKNLYLWPGQSLIRKGLEAVITVLIELFWPKERILEIYLNIAEFGPGLFGIGKTTNTLLGLPPSQLDPEMSARMAAVLPSPKRMRIEPPSPFALERSQWVLRQMTHLTGTSYAQVDSIEQTDDIDPFPTDSLSVLLNENTIRPVIDTNRAKIPTDSLFDKTNIPDSLLQQPAAEADSFEN